MSHHRNQTAWIVCAVLVMLAGFVLACQAEGQTTTAQGNRVEVNNGYYTNITPEQLAPMLKNKDFVLVNVHIPYEGEIEKTDLFIPFDRVSQNLNLLPQDKNAKIILYCRSGPMSTSASKALVDAGYTNVLNLDGGMGAWRGKGYEVLNRGR
ncbi:MAG: rhodanese-like domain-containing protein [Chloroflexi bacterium]|nr:rhodanese-like domain-containing protein [Chloroflexota bacterium]